VLARYLLDTPAEVRDLRVLDFASGSGLVAIAAARAGARSVLAVDIDPLAVAATELNAEAAGVRVEARAVDLTGQALDGRFDVLLAGDVFYDAGAAARFLPWFRELAAAGARVLVGDPGRAYVPTRGVSCLFRADVPVPLGLESRETLASRVLVVEATDDRATS
jgi:predicted nicotinamide N-methyase